MHFEGLLVGIGTFLIIGVMHSVVIKTEYHFGVKAWPAYLAAGLLLAGASLFLQPAWLSALAAVAGCTFLWGIHELFEQRARVERGWHPKKPGREARGDAGGPRPPDPLQGA